MRKMPDGKYIKNKTKEEILADLKGTAEPGSVVHEQQKMAIIVRCTQDSGNNCRCNCNC
jgi:hypothetical protein